MAKTLHSRHNKIFLDKLRKLRTSRSLRQADLALLLGRTQNRVSNVERGQTRLDIIELREWLHPLLKGIDPLVRRPTRSLEPRPLY
jgi:transcriptional regulator with XRE-family HTH domain